MNLRFYHDADTDLPHICAHSVEMHEVEEVLRYPLEDARGRSGSRVAIGQTAAGRILKVVYVPDDVGDGIFVMTAYDLRGKPLAVPATHAEETTMSKQPKTSRKNRFPKGWNDARVRRLIDHYEKQSETDAAAEDDSTFDEKKRTFMQIPARLVPAVRKLLQKKTG